MPAARIVNTASMGSTMPDSMPPQNARPFFIPSARRGINNKKDCSTAFEEQHRAELTAYRAAAAYFKANNITKLPSPKKLEAEYAQLASEKAKFYEQYKEAKSELLKLKTAKQNVASFFREEEPAQQER